MIYAQITFVSIIALLLIGFAIKISAEIAFAFVISLLLGFGVGLAISAISKHSTFRLVIIWLASIFCIGAWLTSIGGLLYWLYTVEPRLDGREGVGHILYFAVFYLVTLLALFLSGIVMGIWLSHKHN